MSRTPLIGFISPPAWYDPSPAEFRDIVRGEVRVQQYLLPLPGFDWRIESIARTEPDQRLAAECLGAAGCDVVATVGTPFGWAGLRSVAEARARSDRLARAAGAPSVMAGIAVLDALKALAVRKIGLACTYYADDWRNRWAAYVAASGFDVLSATTLADDGLMPRHDPADKAYWAPTPAQISSSVRKLVREAPGVEAVTVSGAGARTLSFIASLEEDLGVAVIGSDSALYWSIGRTLGIELNSGMLGSLSGLLSD